MSPDASFSGLTWLALSLTHGMMDAHQSFVIGMIVERDRSLSGWRAARKSDEIDILTVGLFLIPGFYVQAKVSPLMSA